MKVRKPEFLVSSNFVWWIDGRKREFQLRREDGVTHVFKLDFMKKVHKWLGQAIKYLEQKK